MSDAGVSETLDVLMIGCGRIAGGFDEAWPEGARSHAGAYRRHPGFRLAACVDPDGTRRRAFMDHWQVADGFATLKEALEAGTGFDVASVCSPTANHAHDLEALLEARPRAVFCEKPIAGEIEAARRLVEVYEAQGIPLAVNHLRRWDTRLIVLKGEIEAGRWGAVRNAAGFYTQGIVHNGTHLIDLVHFLLGPATIAAIGPARANGEPADPTVDAILTLANGAAVHLVAGHAADYALFELTIVTEQGIIALEDSGYSLRIRAVADSPRYAGYRQPGEAASEPTGLEDALANAVADLYEVIIQGRRPASDGRSALAAHELCESLRKGAS